MADPSTDPVSAGEAASMLDAHNLFRKATRVLTEVNEAAKVRWPEWGWGNKDQVAQLILGQFQRHARFTISTTSKPVYLILGYTDLLATGEAHLTVWVESDPKKVAVRMALLKAADEGGLHPSWIRRTDSWQALGKTHRAATLEGAQDTVDWLLARLEDLEASGLGPSSA